MNGLLRAVDGLCAARDWDGLVELAEACEDAVERGKQLWPIAAHIDHRLALEAPGDVAASALTIDTGRFALGPLTEVVASTHTWSELADHIDEPLIAAYVAQERVLRGEVLTDDPRAHPDVLGLPLELLPWEPTYTLATYRADVVEVPEPWTPTERLDRFERRPAEEHDDPELAAALLDLVQPWTSESNGAARAVVVDGDAVAAVSDLTLDSFSMGPLKVDEAVQLIAWAAASGGAHGRRRGAALGRSLAFYLLSLVGDGDPVTVGNDPNRYPVRWFRWVEDNTEEGWVLRLALEHEADGWAAALAATDLLDDSSV